MTGPPLSVATEANQTLSRLCGAGIALGIIGGIVMAVAWPTTEVGILGDPEESGSAGVAIFGGLLCALGNYMVFVALIGWGVKFGNLASRPTD